MSKPSGKPYDEIEADALKAAHAAEWRKIETAPKDGTWVLVAGGKPDPHEWYGETPIPPAIVAMWDVDRWGFADWDGGLRSVYLNPTHWMPLPAPPVEQAKTDLDQG